MRWRVIAVVSVGVNVLLAAVWLALPLHLRSPSNPFLSLMGDGQAGSSRTNFVVRRQFFSWRDVESPDYPVYIANLRAIGCPEQTIRDIIMPAGAPPNWSRPTSNGGGACRTPM